MNIVKVVKELHFLWDIQRQAVEFRDDLDKGMKRKRPIFLDGALVGAVGEKLACDLFGLQMARKVNQKGFDAVYCGKKIEIKTKRRISNEDLENCENKTVVIQIVFDDNKKLEQINIYKVHKNEDGLSKSLLLIYAANKKRKFSFKQTKEYCNEYTSWITKDKVPVLDMACAAAYSKHPILKYRWLCFKRLFGKL